MDTYLVPAGTGRGEYEEKRSRFIALLMPVESEEEAAEKIAAVKKEHYDARHNCFAYIIRGGATRCSDDGEPQGTAGQPILSVLSGAGLENVCCVVTRYFGGVLLGTGGLARAYAAAAKSALEQAGISRMAKWAHAGLTCGYSMYERVRRLTEDWEGIVSSADFGVEVGFQLLIREDKLEGFTQALREMSGGSAELEITGESFRGVRIK